MVRIIFADVTFMFDNNSPFAHYFEFEKSLFDFFDSKGLQAEVIKSMEGAVGKRIVLVTKKPDMGQPEPPKPVGRPVTLKGQIRRLSDRKFRAPARAFMKGK
jgi:hypothetical protein